MTVGEKKMRKFASEAAVKLGLADEWKREAAKKNTQQILEFWESGHSLEEARAQFLVAR